MLAAPGHRRSNLRYGYLGGHHLVTAGTWHGTLAGCLEAQGDLGSSPDGLSVSNRSRSWVASQRSSDCFLVLLYPAIRLTPGAFTFFNNLKGSNPRVGLFILRPCHSPVCSGSSASRALRAPALLMKEGTLNTLTIHPSK